MVHDLDFINWWQFLHVDFVMLFKLKIFNLIFNKVIAISWSYMPPHLNYSLCHLLLPPLSITNIGPHLVLEIRWESINAEVSQPSNVSLLVRVDLLIFGVLIVGSMCHWVLALTFHGHHAAPNGKVVCSLAPSENNEQKTEGCYLNKLSWNVVADCSRLFIFSPVNVISNK